MGEYVVFNSGFDTKYFGTGFMVSKEIKESVIEFIPISEKICKIRLRGRFRKISMVNIHAPTNDKEEAEKDAFYEELMKIVNEIPKYDVEIIISDINAKVGKEECFKDITGGHSKHEQSNENGIKLIEFALEANMKISSTAFQRKEIHKGTWTSACGNYCNQIDHLVIERKHAKIVKDIRR